MRGLRAPLTGLGTAHDERQRHQAQHNQRHAPEAVLKTQCVRLGYYRLIGQGESFRGCGGSVEPLRDKQRLESGEVLLEIDVAVAGMR